VADRRQLVFEIGCDWRLEGWQVENLQDRRSAKRIVDLGPREDRGSQCGSRDGVLGSRNAWRFSIVANVLDGMPCMYNGHALMIHTKDDANR
jgi:hypothetical protein